MMNAPSSRLVMPSAPVLGLGNAMSFGFCIDAALLLAAELEFGGAQGSVQTHVGFAELAAELLRLPVFQPPLNVVPIKAGQGGAPLVFLAGAQFAEVDAHFAPMFDAPLFEVIDRMLLVTEHEHP